MLVGGVIELLVAALCIVPGLMIWIGRKVFLLHSYHYKNVKPEDFSAYCRLIGIGLTVMGLGIATTGILNIFYLPLWWIPLVFGFVVGIAVLVIAQKKYNGTIM